MRMLALDIGVGTTDIMLIDSEKNSENCSKAVIPSPARRHAAAVRAATKGKKDLFILGDTVGGGEFSSALKRHVAAGLKVTMTEEAAFSVRNDLDEVRERGIAVVADRSPPAGFAGDVLWLQEVQIGEIVRFFEAAGESGAVDSVAIAVQDHGVSPKGVSNRTTRIERFRQIISRDRRLESLCFEKSQVPKDFLRLRCAAARAGKEIPEARVFVMDTSPVAALGCLEDPDANRDGCVLAVNAGNGHTLAVLLQKMEVLGAMEAHTRAFDSKRLGKFLRGFLNSTLSNEDVFDDGGHGLFRLEEKLPKPDQVLVTGPNRTLMEGSGMKFRYATPAGDVMMTGPMGLNRAVQHRKS
ncbi:MAG: DUF1786 domain-containing protein [Methanomassiliicoccales archaeon]|nr:DUF1786 domain-containing protein [Methanomassiliicoccales archaeon]